MAMTKRSRANWSNEIKKIFIYLCIEEVELGGQPGAYMKPSSWKRIIARFNEKTGLGYHQKQLKNMLDIMKKQYATWNKLIAQKGITFNEHIHTVSMEPERWKDYLKVYVILDLKTLFIKGKPQTDISFSPFIGKSRCKSISNKTTTLSS